MKQSIQNAVLLAGIFAALAAPQTTPSKSVLGTVTGFKVKANSYAILLHPDRGAPLAAPFGPATQVVRVAPGQRDLSQAETARVTDIVPGDRVMISFVHGTPEARRIVLITATDIARRNELYRQDWQNRGIGGVVASSDGNAVVLRAGDHTTTVTITGQTTIRRYAPDSVNFADALFSSAADILPGDQLQARGDRTPDGLQMTAQEIVFGTFLTRAGKITSVDPAAQTVTVLELETNRPLLIRLSADSRLKLVPDMRDMMGHMHHGGGEGPPPGSPMGPAMSRMLEQLPAARFEDLQPGGWVVVTSTKSAQPGAVTAIMLLARADFVVQMMQAAAAGGHGANSAPEIQEILRRHGMSGGGFSLPAIIP